MPPIPAESTSRPQYSTCHCQQLAHCFTHNNFADLNGQRVIRETLGQISDRLITFYIGRIHRVLAGTFSGSDHGGPVPPAFAGDIVPQALL